VIYLNRACSTCGGPVTTKGFCPACHAYLRKEPSHCLHHSANGKTKVRKCGKFGYCSACGSKMVRDDLSGVWFMEGQ